MAHQLLDSANDGSLGVVALADGDDGYSLEGSEEHPVEYPPLTLEEKEATLTMEESDSISEEFAIVLACESTPCNIRPDLSPVLLMLHVAVASRVGNTIVLLPLPC